MRHKGVFFFDQIHPVEGPARGGVGNVLSRGLFGPNTAEPGSPFAAAGVNVLPPGASIGVHRHEGEAEVYVILDGRGSYINDAGEKIPVKAGDLAFCQSGESHGLVNDGDVPLRMAGIIARK